MDFTCVHFTVRDNLCALAYLCSVCGVCMCGCRCERLMSRPEKHLNFNDAEDDIVCPSACYTDTSSP